MACRVNQVRHGKILRPSGRPADLFQCPPAVNGAFAGQMLQRRVIALAEHRKTAGGLQRADFGQLPQIQAPQLDVGADLVIAEDVLKRLVAPDRVRLVPLLEGDRVDQHPRVRLVVPVGVLPRLAPLVGAVLSRHGRAPAGVRRGSASAAAGTS